MTKIVIIYVVLELLALTMVIGLRKRFLDFFYIIRGQNTTGKSREIIFYHSKLYPRLYFVS